MKAMIFAAGLGTRLYPITQSTPKALVSVNGKPLLEHIILKLKNAGFDQIVINIHHFPNQIIDFLKVNNYFDTQIYFSDERNKLLDTGGGLKKAASFFDDGKPFLVHNVDILSNVCLKDVYNQHVKSSDRLATLVVSHRDTYRYLLFNNELMLRGWVNTKTNQTKPHIGMKVDDFKKYAFAGIQVISPIIFELMQQENEKFPIMPFYLHRCQEQRIAGFIPNNLKLLDVGKNDALVKADTFLKEL